MTAPQQDAVTGPLLSAPWHPNAGEGGHVRAPARLAPSGASTSLLTCPGVLVASGPFPSEI